MPVNRRPTPPPEAIKQPNTVMDALNAWTDLQDEEEDKSKKRKVPLGYTPIAQQDGGTATGWRAIFDSESDNFNFGVGMIIIGNAVVIGLETDMGRERFVVLEHFFNACFVAEMLTRILQIGCEYFTTFKYLFDCSLVLAGSLDLWILPALTHKSDEGGVGYQFQVMRLLRILRLMRILRVIRIFRMFGQLLLIITAFGKALQVVVLLSVLVVILIYALAIVCTQMVGHNSARWGENKEELEQWFGTIGASMCTLFWLMFGSGWDPIRELLTQVYPDSFVLVCFASYMIITVALMALIIGLISESLIIAQQEFKQKKLTLFGTKKKALAAEYTEELYALLEDEMDENGEVDFNELKSTVKGDAALTGKLMAVGIAIQADGLVGLVDTMSNSGKNRVSVDHFIEKLINLSGNASASQVVDLKYDIVKNRQILLDIQKKLTK